MYMYCMLGCDSSEVVPRFVILRLQVRDLDVTGRTPSLKLLSYLWIKFVCCDDPHRREHLKELLYVYSVIG